MAEKIKIFELDIDVDAALKASKEFKVESEDLKKKLDDLKKAGDTTSEQYVELEARYKSVRSEYSSSQRELGKLINLQGKNIQTVDQARSALSVVSKQWAEQAQLYGVNSKEADKLAAKKLELTERLKELEKQTGDNRRNVGNYGDALSALTGQSVILQSAQEALTTVMAVGQPVYAFLVTQLQGIKANYVAATAGTVGFSRAQKAAAIATNLGSAALKLFKIALVSTGIGAVVVLLGSLVAYFTRTQKGIDMVNTVLAALGAGFDVVIDRLSKFAGAMGKFLSGDFSGGIDGITDSFRGMGDEIQREIDLAVKLERVLQEVEKSEINLDIRRAAANARLNELKKTAEDASLSTQERIKATEQYAKIEEALVAEEVANQEKRVAAMLGYAKVTDEVREKIRLIGEEGVALEDLGISESTVEDMKLFRDEVVKLFDARTRSLEKQTENQNKRNTLLDEQQRKEKEAARAAAEAAKERQQRAQEAIDAAIAESKTRLQIFIEENERKADTLKEDIALQEEVRDRRLAILKEELEAKKLSQSEYELAVLQTKNEFLDQQAQLTAEYAQKEIEAEKERLAQRQELEALEKERKATDLENKLAIEEENFQARMELELERLAMMRQQELDAAEKTGASKALIHQKYAKMEEEIEFHKESTKRQMAADTFGQVAKLLGEQTVAGKAAAIAQATINTYQGVTEVWRSPSILPEPFATIQKVVSTGTVLASGLGAVQKITSTNADVPKAAKGITLRGRSHAEGGETLYDRSGTPLVEAEADENIYVLNKRASGLVNALSYINQATGGIPLSNATTYAAAGGMVKSSGYGGAPLNGQLVDYDLLAEKMAQANMKLPAPQVAVTEINDGQGRYAQIVDGANF